VNKQNSYAVIFSEKLNTALKKIFITLPFSVQLCKNIESFNTFIEHFSDLFSIFLFFDSTDERSVFETALQLSQNGYSFYIIVEKPSNLFFNEHISQLTPIGIIDLASSEQIVKTSILNALHENNSLKNIDILKESDHLLNLFLEYSPSFVFFKDEQIRALRLSRNYEKMLERPLSEILNKTMFELFPSELARKMVDDDKKILERGVPLTIEEELNGRNYSTTKFPIHRDGKPPLMAGFTIDITDRFIAEKKLENALHQKQQLFRELEHRVKNSLSILTSILNLEIDRSDQTDCKEILKTINNRLNSIRKLYELMTYSKNITKIPLNDYIEKLSQGVLDSYQSKERKITLDLHLTSLFLNAKDTASIGLIINEVLINSLKHAFSSSDGTISITLNKTDKHIELTIHDSGKGFDTQFNIEHSHGLGWTLITLLSNQLKGTIHLKTDDGTLFVLQIPYNT
jgi:PAS domain S-box-containing protein